jgi:hypothetical protein
MELLERVAGKGAVLLQVDSRIAAGSDELASVLLLTFDVGRVLLRANPRRSELEAEVLEPGTRLPAGVESAADREPWWRVLGAPLLRVWPVGPALASGVCMQFRADEQQPRIITLEPQGASVRIRLENPPD